MPSGGLGWRRPGLHPGLRKTAIARRLLRIAFAVWRSGKPFDPAMIGKKAGAGTLDLRELGRVDDAFFIHHRYWWMDRASSTLR
jgi:hypothetical protein